LLVVVAVGKAERESRQTNRTFSNELL